MLRVSGIKIAQQENADEKAYAAALKKLRLSPAQVESWHVSKRSVDARDKGDIHLVYVIDVSPRGNESAVLSRKVNVDVVESRQLYLSAAY